MKEKSLYIIYITINVIACIVANYNLLVESIFLRSLGLVVLCVLMFNYQQFKAWMFYVAIFFSSIAESFVILGFEDYPKHTILPALAYYILILIMIKKSVKKINYNISYLSLTSLLISIALIIYLTFNILSLISGQTKENMYFVYAYVAVFLSVLLYLGILYSTESAIRYTWLFFLIICMVFTTLSIGIEINYYPSKILRQVTYVTEIASHVFLLKFLSSTDETVKLI